MKIYYQPVELIINTPVISAQAKVAFNLKKKLANAGIGVEEVMKKQARLPSHAQKKKVGKALPKTSSEKVYVKTRIRDSEANPWDVAHNAAKALGSQAGFIEPDILQEFVADSNIDVPYKKSATLKKTPGAKTVSNDSFDPDWQPHKNLIWHLGDNYSQLKSARESVQNLNHVVRIGHLDTGYSKTHTVIPDSIRKNKLQRNFVDDEDPLDAHDRNTKGKLRMPGHGTGTLGILAGTKVKLSTDEGTFSDYLGAAWFADVVCCRISTSVVLMKTSAFAEAINYLTALTKSSIPVHVVSMSMGGAPSKSWADAVNAAYDAGITIVTAAGNNFNGFPTQHVIYPARFERVIAACGVTNDFRPYHHNKLGEMQGCYGPERHMTKALSAFTPNTPWAAGDQSRIMFSGAGTSSATPQIAAAAALYYRKYYNELNAMEGWKRVEAVRYALYSTASKNGKAPEGFRKCFGNGILQAKSALQVPVNKTRPKTPEDSVPWFPILTTIFKSKPQARPGNKLVMFNTELAQLVFYYPELAKIIDKDEKDYEKISKKKWKQFADAVIEHPGASVTLKKYLMATHQF